MSRLFSRLENMGQDQAGGAPADGPGQPADAPADVLPPSPADAGSPSTGFTPTDTPAMLLPVPGYSISASLARPALPEIAIPMPAPTGTTVVKPGWPTKVWLASLLLLVGLSMLMLAMPERLLPLAARPAPADAATEAAAAVPAASEAAEVADRPAPPSASAVVTAVPAARAMRKPSAAPAPVAPIAPIAPAPSASSAACSEAMLAMNLCSKPSP
jgi:pyruvate dehydrogenase E2 component (dihydrolipoamide acetyltransferase)